jgi:hypothetical protein
MFAPKNAWASTLLNMACLKGSEGFVEQLFQFFIVLSRVSFEFTPELCGDFEVERSVHGLLRFGIIPPRQWRPSLRFAKVGILGHASGRPPFRHCAAVENYIKARKNAIVFSSFRTLS